MDHHKQDWYWIKLVCIFFLGWVVIYAGRTLITPTIGMIQKDFNLDYAAVGLIPSFFYLAYTLLQIPSGALSDRFGKKTLLVPCFIFYALFMFLSGLASSYYLFIFCWILAGAAQGAFYGPQYALSSANIPIQKRALGSAIINSGMAFGISMGYLLTAVMVTNYQMHWQKPLLVMAGFIFLVAIIYIVVIKQDKPKVVKADQETPFTWKVVIELFKNRNLVLAFGIIFCSIYTFFVVLTWLPTYLQQTRGFGFNQSVYISSIVSWSAVVGGLFFGIMSDRLGKRKPIILLTLPLALLAILGVSFISSYEGLVACLVLYGLIGKVSLDPILVSLVADNAPKEHYGLSFGIYNFIGMSSSILAPFLTGYVAAYTGGLKTGFVISSITLLIAIVLALFIKEKN